MRESSVRTRVIHRLRQQLENQSWPRVHMMTILLLTGAFAFLASFLLLQLGVIHMGVRYPLALGFAYFFFLGLLWVWLRTRNDPSDWSEPAEFVDAAPSLRLPGSADDVVSVAAQADDLALPIMLLMGVAGTMLALAWVIYSAPMLLAELMLDGALAASLYRRVRHVPREHWLDTAVKLTWLPFVITGVLLALSGYLLSELAPGATTISETFLQLLGS